MFDVFYSGPKPNLFAHEREALNIEHARQLSRTRYFWWITYLADLLDWDFLWEPKPWEAHQRHAWRSQHQPDAGVYLVPRTWDGKETNYHVDQCIARLPCQDCWSVPGYIEQSSVDFSWHPNPLDSPYVYHFPSQWQPASGVTYTVPGASEIKLLAEPSVQSRPMYVPWKLPNWINFDSVDFSWHPNPLDPPCNYMFSTKWGWDRVGGPVYNMSGAADIKYLDCIVADTQSDPDCWYIPDWIDPNSIDRTWVPNPADPPYIYEFAVEWGWNNVGGPEYRVPGATERKYVDYFVARTWCDPSKFKINYTIENNSDVLRWRPNPADPPFIYIFGNQWWPAEVMPTVEYHVPGATEFKYMDYPRAVLSERHDNRWHTLIDCNWDYSWQPDPGDPPYIYVFGNQWYSGEIMPTVEYHVPGATERKFVEHPRAQLLDNNEHWYVTCKEQPFSFDISWRPDPGDPPYIYIFGNQWHSSEVMPTIEYRVPGAVEKKYMDYPRATLLPVLEPWTVPDELDQSNIDFSWCPDPGSPPYVYHFGTDYQASVGLTYTVPGATELKFAGEIPTVQKEKPTVIVPDIFYMDRSNAVSADRFVKLQERFPHAQKIRYVNSVMDTVKRCLPKTKQNRFWVVSSENDYTDFDFAWLPQTWQSGMTHVFGTQWNKWSDTFLINRWEFERCSKWAKSLEDFPNLNFVKDQQVVSPADALDIYVIDFGNQEAQQVIKDLSDRYRVVKTVRFFDNYLDTLKRIVTSAEGEHIWVVGTVCDYTRFDFSWQPEAWQRDMLHVFPSNEQKFGDTFYIPVRQFVEQMNQLELLDWFDTVNYCTDQTVPRWAMPIVKHDYDTHVEALTTAEWLGPIAVFKTNNINIKTMPTVSLWREKTRTIVPLDSGAESTVIPRSAIPYIRTQLYDYPYIDKTQRIGATTPQDVIFISNGESMAETNWQHLKSICPRAKRSDGITGREAAYKAAAMLSTTPWFYAVFAKTEVLPSFQFDYAPDRMQQPKHYIFHSRNALNGLEYGAMNINLYNRQLVLDTKPGLDFTLSAAHEVVPICISISRFNTDPWVTWRSAFREVLKLKREVDLGADVEIQHRLSVWTSKAQGENAEHCLRGANDALNYYEQVNGSLDALQLSFDWAWLQDYYYSLYQQRPWLESV